MSECGNERFAILLDLASQIADQQKMKSLVIVRTFDQKWLVTLRNLRILDDDPLPPFGGEGTLDAALEVFVINPPI